MNIYKDYIKEIEERKAQGLNPKPIDGAELLSEIIWQIKDTETGQILLIFLFTTPYQEPQVLRLLKPGF
jgi:aconitase B